MRKLILCFCLILPVHLYGSFEDIESGARATAMGGAFVAQGDDMNSIFYNPSGLVGVSRYEVSASYDKLLYGLSDNSSMGRNQLAIGGPLKFRGKYLGAAGLGWETLALDALYSESMISLGYGYPLTKKIWVGMNLNSLSLAYGSDEYTKINPVFDSGYQKSNIGFDVGFTRKGEILDIGFAIQNLNEPDLGLKYVNKIARKISLGLSVKQESLVWNTEVNIINSDFKIKTGGEKSVFKKLLHDKVLMRGGIGIGSRSFRNIALGFGYKDNSYKIDYSFLYPLGGLAETAGSHQISFAYDWGKSIEIFKKAVKEPSEEEVEELLKEKGGVPDQMEPPPEIIVTNEDRIRAKALIKDAQKRIANGRYDQGLDKLKEADKILVHDLPVKDLIRKLVLIVNVSPSLSRENLNGQLFRKAVSKYMNNDSDAVIVITYAQQTWPRDIIVRQIKDIIGTEFPSVFASYKMLPGISILDQLLQDALELIRAGRFVQSIGTLEKVLDIDPNNITALTRIGSAYWAMGKKDIARSHWEKVLKLDPENIDVKRFLKGN